MREAPCDNPDFVIDATAGLHAARRGFWRKMHFSHSGKYSIQPEREAKPAAVLLYVHGYNEQPGIARGYGKNNIAAGYREAGGTAAAGTFLWHSRFGFLSFEKSRRAATATAPAFARAVGDLASQGVPVHVIAHSLGAHLVLTAVRDFEIQLEDVAFVAPAIRWNALEQGSEFFSAAARCRRILFTWNRADRSLLWHGLWWGRALGRCGARNPGQLPPNIIAEDMQHEWRTHADDGGHGAILHPGFWPVFWARLREREWFGLRPAAPRQGVQ